MTPPAAASGRPRATGVRNGAVGELGEHFRVFQEIMYEDAGVHLPETKRQLVQARLAKRLRAKGWTDFRRYAEFVQAPEGREERKILVDRLTTNKTSFFREPAHLKYLRDVALPRLRAAGDPVRLWCAGCSTGEEPYSIAMTVRSRWPDVAVDEFRILATDISPTVVEKARAGRYRPSDLTGVPERLISRFFRTVEVNPEGGDVLEVRDEVRSLVRVARLNLMDPWPMRRPLHVIFCRNVMIYFDQSTRRRLVERFHETLVPGGILFVGHSESLRSLAGGFDYVRPAVYRR